MSKGPLIVLPRGSQAWLAGGVRRPPGNARLHPGTPDAAQALRHEMLSIRYTMRELMARQQIARDSTILYSGFNVMRQAELFKDFQSWLSAQDAPRTIYLEATEAGRYLHQATTGFLTHWLKAADWNERQMFRDGGRQYTVSLMGFWRELSARFARKASGTVHLLLPPERVELLDVANAFWKMRRASHEFDEGGFLDSQRETRFARSVSEKLLSGRADEAARVFTEELRVLGFVEFPVLYGWIATNAGVDGIRVYTCDSGRRGKHGHVFKQVRDERIDAMLPRGR